MKCHGGKYEKYVKIENVTLKGDVAQSGRVGDCLSSSCEFESRLHR